MLNNNEYLRKILKNVGGNVTGIKNDNRLLKEISEKIGAGGSVAYSTLECTVVYTDGSRKTVELLKSGDDE